MTNTVLTPADLEALAQRFKTDAGDYDYNILGITNYLGRECFEDHRESMTAQEVFDCPKIPVMNKLWVFIHHFLSTDEQLRAFTRNCKEQISRLVDESVKRNVSTETCAAGIAEAAAREAAWAAGFAAAQMGESRIAAWDAELRRQLQHALELVRNTTTQGET